MELVSILRVMLGIGLLLCCSGVMGRLSRFCTCSRWSVVDFCFFFFFVDFFVELAGVTYACSV